MAPSPIWTGHRPRLKQHGLTVERARIHFLRGNLHFPRGNIDGCLAEHGRSLELAREVGSPELEAQALGGLGDAEYVRGRMISAHRHLRALRRARRLSMASAASRSPTAARSPTPACTSSPRRRRSTRRWPPPRRPRASAIIAPRSMPAWPRSSPARRSAPAIDLQDAGRGGRASWCAGSAPAASCRAVCSISARRRSPRGGVTRRVALLEEALAISRETGIGFHGPNILGGARRGGC